MGGAATWALHTGSGERSSYNVAHRGRAGQPDTGRERSQKDPSRRTGATRLTKVGSESFADIREQWQLVHQPAFAVDDDLAGPPVNLVKLKRDNLSRPQAESRQQKQDRVVSASRWRRPLRRRQHAFHFLRGKERSWSGLTVLADHGN
jgi:hypothetical protein